MVGAVWFGTAGFEVGSLGVQALPSRRDAEEHGLPVEQVAIGRRSSPILLA